MTKATAANPADPKEVVRWLSQALEQIDFTLLGLSSLDKKAGVYRILLKQIESGTQDLQELVKTKPSVQDKKAQKFIDGVAATVNSTLSLLKKAKPFSPKSKDVQVLPVPAVQKIMKTRDAQHKELNKMGDALYGKPPSFNPEHWGFAALQVAKRLLK